MDTKHKLPPGFESPTALPNPVVQEEWQKQNRSWWEKNPMRYDWGNQIPAPEFSREFYHEIDKRFFDDSARYMPPATRPFDEIIPFAELRQKAVLEIGVGNGSHAQLIAPHCKTYTGIDLTEYAATSSRKRFELFELSGDFHQMDAERMTFPDSSFDFVWSWGVIHHSANTGQILAEINRVLQPGGSATIMVYHRSFLYYYLFSGLFRGFLCGGFFKTPSLHKLVQLHTDGAIARYYSIAEWKRLVEDKGFALKDVRVKGQKSEVFPLPASRLKDVIMRATPNALTRFVLNKCRQGSFLITTVRKR